MLRRNTTKKSKEGYTPVRRIAWGHPGLSKSGTWTHKVPTSTAQWTCLSLLTPDRSYTELDWQFGKLLFEGSKLGTSDTEAGRILFRYILGGKTLKCTGSFLFCKQLKVALNAQNQRGLRFSFVRYTIGPIHGPQFVCFFIYINYILTDWFRDEAWEA